MFTDYGFVWILYFYILGLAFLFIFSLTSIIPIFILAKKTNTPNAWLAWIPIAHYYLLCKIGQKPGWWMLLILLPILGLIFFVLAWMGICYVRQRPTWLGLLIVMPCVNVVLPWYLALSDEKSTV